MDNEIALAKEIISDAMRLLPSNMDSRQARAMLIAIGLQESRFKHRKQIGGPAHGFWQFEKGGGVKGVLNHATTSKLARQVCNACCVSPDADSVYDALATDDVLACCFARLLLWTDPKAIPAVGNEQASWELYSRVWRPGQPHRQSWGDLYAAACNAA